MEELINFLKENDVEITDDLKEEINNIWESNMPTTDDLFTQDELDKIIEKRLARAERSYQSEIDDLKEAMENMVDPEKVEEYEAKIEELEEEKEEENLEQIKEKTEALSEAMQEIGSEIYGQQGAAQGGPEAQGAPGAQGASGPQASQNVDEQNPEADDQDEE